MVVCLKLCKWYQTDISGLSSIFYMAYNVQGFVFGTTDAIRRLGQKPNSEPKIQCLDDAKQRNVGLRTGAQRRGEAADAQSQPC